MRIYFDHNATTPVDPAVVEAVTRTLSDEFGNASSVHHFGQQAKACARRRPVGGRGADRRANPRRSCSRAAAPKPTTSRCAARPRRFEPTGRRHLIASAIEHEAVLTTLKALARRGWRTTLLPVGRIGHRGARTRCGRRSRTRRRSSSVMHANNEIGTIQPIAELARHRARARRALSHRRGAVGRQDPGRRARARRRPAVALGAQVLRTRRGRARSGSSAARA